MEIFNDILNFIKDHIVIISILCFLIAVFIYSICSVTINELNKAKYGKTSWMAWIPPFNLFLLGKLTIHTIFGILLAIGLFLSIGVTVTTNGVQEYYSILPENILIPYTIVYSAIIIILLIYAHIKAKALIRKEGEKNEASDFQNNNENLNNPIIEKQKSEVINDPNNIYSNFKDTPSSNYHNSTVSKISLTSITNHKDDNDENSN